MLLRAVQLAQACQIARLHGLPPPPESEVLPPLELPPEKRFVVGSSHAGGWVDAGCGGRWACGKVGGWLGFSFISVGHSVVQHVGCWQA